ncbi:unnamed protein product [Kuraishia capsulata CBS 1993]|uniref:LicD/FKTN/FKRP nucleotidyltransferase domain-containing protein n=1 Tax=Kuraishia capsulata CBS 1993 TaxID=1382522 RepID=W6MIV2_9ASCO|nr:uncharacterized protein KUCA_T00002067001 [Kuraishia capsulata CBS 1993]CDK26096.1 unnamed protein product [Kuraishia capsulata CBS 1993]
MQRNHRYPFRRDLSFATLNPEDGGYDDVFTAYNSRKPSLPHRVRSVSLTGSLGEDDEEDSIGSDDPDDRLIPLKIRLTHHKMLSLVHKWRSSRLAKFLIPLLYLLSIIIFIFYLSSRHHDDDLDLYLDRPRKMGWMSRFFGPRAKTAQEVQLETDSNNLVYFPYSADVSVLPIAPYNHAKETSDLRATQAVYYDAIREFLEKSKVNPKTPVPEFDFHWGDWIEMKDLNPLIKEKLTCFVIGVLGSNIRTTWPGCIDKKSDDPRDLNFIFNGPATEFESPFRLSLRAKSYLYSVAPNPSKVVLLAGDLAFVVKVAKKKDIVESGMVEKFIDSRVSESISRLEVLKSPVNPVWCIDDISKSLGRPVVDLNGGEFTLIDVAEDAFDFPEDKKKSKRANDARVASQAYFKDTMIFHDGERIRKEYDWRFFNVMLTQQERRAVLHQLVRAWLQMTFNLALTTWLSQETLLGWGRNGLFFPWETVLHFEMPAKDLSKVASTFNGSIVINDPNDGTGTYFLDVSPHYMERARFNDGNASPESTDVRFIDIRTGVYIEISGLVRSQARLPGHFVSAYQDEPEIAKDIKDGDSIAEGGRFVNSGMGNFYHLSQVTPLRKTLFEGLMANVPQRAFSLLHKTYPDIMNADEFNNHHYIQHLRLWVPLNKCKYVPQEDIELFNRGGSSYIGACHDADIWSEYNRTRAATLFKQLEGFTEGQLVLSAKDELPCLYDDVWTTRRIDYLHNEYGYPLPVALEEKQV